MIQRQFTCLAFAILSILSTAQAAGDEYSHRVWSTRDGLPQNKIQALAQTSDAYLWIGTAGGLVRFDGLRFVIFDRASTSALREDSILSLLAAKDGSLWIGTEGGGIVHYRNGLFQAFGKAEGLTNLFIRAIIEDSHGEVLVGSDRGFFRFDSGHLIRIDATSEVPVASAMVLYEDHEGRIWLGGSLGLVYYEKGKLHHYRQNGAPFTTEVRTILQTHDNTLLIATVSGIYRLQTSQLQLVRGLENIDARGLLEDEDGGVWIGTIGGGLIHKRVGSTITYHRSDFLPAETISSIFEDRDRNLWVGTPDGLLCLRKTAFTTLTSRNGLSDDNVSSLYRDSKNVIWIATITGRLFQVANEQTVSPFRFPAPVENFHAGTVYQDRDGSMWFGGTTQGILHLSGGVASTYGLNKGLRSTTIRQFLRDRNGILWVATGSGFSRWDNRTFQTFYLEDGLAYGGVRCIIETRSGDLLLGTDGGANRVRNGKFIQDPTLARLMGEKVWSILEDPDGATWFGTRGSGLFLLRNGVMYRFTTTQGLMSNYIYQLVDDGRGKLWMSSPSGVFSAGRAELTSLAEGKQGPVGIAPYESADVMESSQMNGGIQFAGIRSASGEIWFGGVKGVVRINPAEVRISNPPPVLIESVLVDDHLLPVTSAITIPAGRHKLEIDYTACNLVAPERVTFRYMLEGIDDSWTSASTHRAAYYTNLPPGHYRFHVLARDATATKQPAEASIAFAWQPRFFETGWFYAACCVAFVLILWLALRFYTHQTRARYALLLAERTRLAREMHDTVIQGCVGVSTLLEAASSSKDPQIRGLLDQARTHIRLTLDEARQAVWDLRHDSFANGVGPTLSAFAKKLTEENGIDVKMETLGTPSLLTPDLDRNLLLVAREAIRNAVAHARPSHVNVSLNFESAQIHLQVVDDGSGFHLQNAQQRSGASGHYGIVGMRERIQQLGGIFNVESEPGHGTRVTATVPLKTTT